MATETINTFLKNRFQYHAGSRVGISTSQSFAQATNGDGHTILKAKVWAPAENSFPVNTGDNKTTSDIVAATKDLVTVFKTDALSAYIDSNDTTKGVVWTNSSYPSVKLYENAVMNTVLYSDGAESGGKYQAYELTVNGSRIKDWVSPVAIEENGLPVPGYAGIVEVKKSTGDWTIIQRVADNNYQWELAKGTWEFVYGPGMLIFDPSVTPEGKGWPNVRITAFAYIGNYLDDELTTIEDHFGTLSSAQVVVAGDSNDIKTTGYTIGGASMASSDNTFTGSSTVLATESAIKNIVDGDELTELDSSISTLLSNI